MSLDTPILSPDISYADRFCRFGARGRRDAPLPDYAPGTIWPKPPPAGGNPALETIELLRHFPCSPRKFFLLLRFSPIDSDWLRLSPTGGAGRRPDFELFEPLPASSQAAGLNFCVASGFRFQVSAFSYDVKEQGAAAPLYYMLSCSDSNESKIIRSFSRGGEKIQQEGALCLRIGVRSARCADPAFLTQILA